MLLTHVCQPLAMQRRAFSATAPARYTGTVRHPQRWNACNVLNTKQVLGVHKPRLSYVGVAHAGDGISPGKATWGEQIDGLPPPPPITKTDGEFEAMGVEFVQGVEGIKVTELNELFLKVGFPQRDPERLKVALDHSHRLVWIRSTRASRFARLGQLLGFARATSDGAFSATIWDVAVAPAWQRSGLGRALIERLTRGLVEDGLPTIALYAEPQVVGLYKKLGFLEDPQGIRGMAFQRRGDGGTTPRASVTVARPTARV